LKRSIWIKISRIYVDFRSKGNIRKKAPEKNNPKTLFFKQKIRRCMNKVFLGITFSSALFETLLRTEVRAKYWKS
jgi:hypothetical protein